MAGSRSYAVLPGNPAVIGRAGRLMTFQIAIEGGITGIDRAAFAQFVRDDVRRAAGVGVTRAVAVPAGRAGAGPGLHVDAGHAGRPATRSAAAAPDRYTSCRIGDRVVLNVARWVHGVPKYGAPLTAYRQYMINHETGHRLGRGHELCPGPGQPAPVMQQQTLGLHGCTPYAWPYLDGVRYTGRLGQYDDRVPQS